ncbi:MAG TPA: BON domain-containing protein [Kofleriaceae bacterium]|nr:BON domain-containing protein [Kofleriaceae bacterium]
MERFADRFGQPCGTHYYADRTDNGAMGASHYYSDRVEADEDFGDRFGRERSGYGGGRGGATWSRGPHYGKGPANFTRSDERIEQLVGEALQDDDQLDATGITVEVAYGEVILDGMVTDHRIKRMAEDVALHVRGVHDVQNRIRICDPQLTKGVAT